MAYSVFARKYRPQTFDEVVGQAHIVRTLKNAIAEDRVGHAHLFSGPRGVGKTTMARIFAKALNCAEGPTTKPCGACELCVSIAAGSDADVVEIDAASNRLVADAEALRQGIQYAPLRARVKVCILDEVHMLSSHAFNALLKTLEEPPPHVKFVFATTEPQKVPDTIRSRCQHFEFRRMSTGEIAERLAFIAGREGIDAPAAVLRTVALHAQGSVRDAESMLDQLAAYKRTGLTEDDLRAMLGAASEAWIFRLVDRILEASAPDVLRMVEEIYLGGADPATLLRQCVEHYRHLLHVKFGARSDAPEELLPQLKRQAEPLSAAAILYAIQLLMEMRRRLRDEADPRLVLELAFVKLALSADLPLLADLADRAPAAAMVTPRSPKGEGGPPISPPPPRKWEPPKPPAKPEPPPPAPKTEGYDAGDLHAVTDRWEAIVTDLRRKDPFLGGVFGDAKPLSIDGDELTVLVRAAEGSYQSGQLEQQKNRAVVERCVGETLGRPVKLHYFHAGPAAAPDAGPVDSVGGDAVRRVTELFPGSRVVEE